MTARVRGRFSSSNFPNNFAKTPGAAFRGIRASLSMSLTSTVCRQCAHLFFGLLFGYLRDLLRVEPIAVRFADEPGVPVSQIQRKHRVCKVVEGRCSLYSKG